MIQIFDNLRKEPKYSSWSQETLYSKLDIIWDDLESKYKSYLSQINPKINTQQSWNNLSGDFYEKLIADYLNDLLPESLRIYKIPTPFTPIRFYPLPSQFKKLVEDTFKVPLLRKCVNSKYVVKIKIEIDLLAIDIRTARIVTILSCKTRYRERIYQPIYAKLHYPAQRFIFITMDRDRELKTCENPSDQRVLLESHMEKVFVNSSHPSIGFCQIVRPFTEAPQNLIDLQKTGSDFST